MNDIVMMSYLVKVKSGHLQGRSVHGRRDSLESLRDTD